MYTRILVPLDGSKVAEGVIPYVTGLARATGGEVIFLRVLEPPVRAAGISMRDQTKSAFKYLNTWAEALRAQGIRSRPAVTQGPVTEAIVKWATDNAAELIALMSHGFGAAAKAVFGSVAERMLELSPLPVLVVRASAEVLQQQQEQEEEEFDEAVFELMGVET